MSWKQTYTGRQYWPTNPDPADVCIEDIAHSLALMCRFNGACRQFYSVAQHSVIVSFACEGGVEHALWGLLHDAAECYLSDVPSPVKPHLLGYVDLEEKNLRAVAEAFAMPWPMPLDIKTLDRRALATEQRDLMRRSAFDWPSVKGIKPFKMKIVPIGPAESERLFLQRFNILMNNRDLERSANER